MLTPIITDLSFLRVAAEEREEENEHFRVFVQHRNSKEMDEAVHRLNEHVTAAVDCTLCGNCCRSLMINIEPAEAEGLAIHLKMPLAELKEKFIEESQQGQLIMNSIPCAFLNDNKCTIYKNRFNECREFPHLHKEGFSGRLFGTLMHYGRCPIIFNVIEQLKLQLGFSKSEHEGTSN